MNQIVDISSLSDSCSLSVKREDLLHPIISGNKFRKLKYTINHVQRVSKTCILTFGGAYSNHIAAVAAAGKLYGIKTIGVIRGEELIHVYKKNPTLVYAASQGMELKFISRKHYAQKETPDFVRSLHDEFGDFYMVPEGGTNNFAIKGCSEILSPEDASFDYVCVSTGTGGTLAGIVASLQPHQKAIGFSALQGTFQKEVVSKYSKQTNFEIVDDYCFGGYAKIDVDLIRFINEFKKNHHIGLDPIYTGKMFFGIFDLLKKGYFKKNSRILAIHTGGMQGVSGMNQKLKKKNLPQIII